jgi:hypothetical protein
MGLSDSAGGKRTCNSSWYLLREQETSEIFRAMPHLVWRDAMMEEYQSIMKNDVWDIVPRLEGKSVVTSKWIYKDQTHS